MYYKKFAWQQYIINYLTNIYIYEKKKKIYIYIYIIGFEIYDVQDSNQSYEIFQLN